MFKAILPKKKINNLDDLEDFITKKSAWVTQGYSLWIFKN